MKHRRQFITAGMATLATGLLPSFGPTSPAWLTDLKAQLAGVTDWLRVEGANDGTVRVHCGVRDFSGLAARAGGLAGRNSRVLAGGNQLRFTLEGTPVCLELYPLT